MQVPTVENVFARSWDLLTRNWVIIVPGVVVGLVVGIVLDLLYVNRPDAYGDTTTSAMSITYGFSHFVAGLVAAVVGIAGYIITQCYTVGMAGAAWQRGTTTLSDGSQAVHDDAGNVLVAAIYLLLTAIVALILAPFTFLLSIFACYLFTLYTIAAAVVGDRRGWDALRESFAITRARFATTLIIGIVLAVLQIIGKVIAAVFSFAPLLGPVIAAIIAQIVVAYAVLVVVGEYLVLRPAASSGITVPPPRETQRSDPGAG
jgi:hypothetical protein